MDDFLSTLAILLHRVFYMWWGKLKSDQSKGKTKATEIALTGPSFMGSCLQSLWGHSCVL